MMLREIFPQFIHTDLVKVMPMSTDTPIMDRVVELKSGTGDPYDRNELVDQCAMMYLRERVCKKI
jgi:hypothetical protein